MTRTLFPCRAVCGPCPSSVHIFHKQCGSAGPTENYMWFVRDNGEFTPVSFTYTYLDGNNVEQTVEETDLLYLDGDEKYCIRPDGEDFSGPLWYLQAIPPNAVWQSITISPTAGGSDRTWTVTDTHTGPGQVLVDERRIGGLAGPYTDSVVCAPGIEVVRMERCAPRSCPVALYPRQALLIIKQIPAATTEVVLRYRKPDNSTYARSVIPGINTAATASATNTWVYWSGEDGLTDSGADDDYYLYCSEDSTRTYTLESVDLVVPGSGTLSYAVSDSTCIISVLQVKTFYQAINVARDSVPPGGSGTVTAFGPVPQAGAWVSNFTGTCWPGALEQRALNLSGSVTVYGTGILSGMSCTFQITATKQACVGDWAVAPDVKSFYITATQTNQTSQVDWPECSQSTNINISQPVSLIVWSGETFPGTDIEIGYQLSVTFNASMVFQRWDQGTPICSQSATMSNKFGSIVFSRA
jgi:hypothetical protein